MKKIAFSLVFIFVLSGISNAQTLYEKQLEYRRKRMEILVNTRLVGDIQKQRSGDASEFTYTHDSTYSYKLSSFDERTGITTELKKISDWVIVRGGLRELDDVEFLYLTDNKALAAELQSKVESRDMWRTVGMITGLAGLGIVIAGAGSENSGSITLGAAVSLVGVIIGALNYPVKHYIYPDFAQEEVDKYNIRLKKDLGLPIDFE